MPKVNAGTVGTAGAALEGVKGLVTEDNGRASSARIGLYTIIGLLVEDVVVRGNPLTWMHVGLFAAAMLGKVAQKFAEKPAQGVVNTKALEHLINTAVHRLARGGGGGDD